VRVLLDTCVLAELQKPQPNPAVREAVARADDDDLFLSVLTIGEITKGIALLAPGKKKRRLAAWLRGLEENFSDRLLAVDREAAAIWGEITAKAQKQGIVVPAVDGQLAATALRHGLHLMTRNTKHVAATGVLVINPWQKD
jgi:predicted nucleic acid-binding protein